MVVQTSGLGYAFFWADLLDLAGRALRAQRARRGPRMVLLDHTKKGYFSRSGPPNS